jgi:hypothetical protein
MAADNEPKLRVQYWDKGKIKPYPNNPRKHDAMVDEMARSIRQFGFTIPVLVKEDGTVIDGHLRLKAAEALGINEIPVIVATHFTEAQEKAFRIMANQSAAWAAWDMGLLRREFEDLKLEDFDLTLTGFDESFFRDVDRAIKDIDIDDGGPGFEGGDDAVRSFEEARGAYAGDAGFEPLTGNFNKGDGGAKKGTGTGEPDHGLNDLTRPLSIALGQGEYTLWRAYKRGLGIDDDKEAFLAMLGAAIGAAA